jgi:hypothetical protein
MDDFQESYGNLVMIIRPSLDDADGRGQHGSGAGQREAPADGESHGHRVRRKNRVSSQSIPASRNGLDKPRVLSCVTERRPNLAYAVVHAVLEVDVRVVAPDDASDLLVRDDLAGPAREQSEQPSGLRLESCDRAVPAKLATGLVEVMAFNEPVQSHPIFFT